MTNITANYPVIRDTEPAPFPIDDDWKSWGTWQVWDGSEHDAARLEAFTVGAVEDMAQTLNRRIRLLRIVRKPPLVVDGVLSRGFVAANSYMESL